MNSSFLRPVPCDAHSLTFSNRTSFTVRRLISRVLLKIKLGVSKWDVYVTPWLIQQRFLVGLSGSNPASNTSKTCAVEKFWHLYRVEISLYETLHHCHFHHQHHHHHHHHHHHDLFISFSSNLLKQLGFFISVSFPLIMCK